MAITQGAEPCQNLRSATSEAIALGIYSPGILQNWEAVPLRISVKSAAFSGEVGHGLGPSRAGRNVATLGPSLA